MTTKKPVISCNRLQLLITIIPCLHISMYINSIEYYNDSTECHKINGVKVATSVQIYVYSYNYSST